ncbi:MAG TPA: 2-oxoacid:acceptor oxidoreductase family protein [Sulfurovum sp.]|jgi:pyruvate ferredoxin oxidoreductase gamma subunit|nr:MAG: ferredoxin oxidoreductase [Sulfurovum sp. 35-42-20]OYY56562.1 MAG: ferredoxin oxidoreductase [Sulfurovum sp. 28-43-6]OYZ26254.1 MAG: ferredoxin oxidoreductase [Sulfurovum sp. 16-42-52]OYZ48852.1 MAG: ferredoxin oxidoreductase [Sulfurovum sp. 24-42-9]OZA46568.1 MAG: ferredoxin oxidoreductase [Sulfurovum sp. 17-42-90]OZA59308.1 MAG: ferredoxin oxidoreductase [Sulfurovum sp. 39-42-12]HQR74113.1 2-oxoacid:acceptor oxidoreductase family protein [Sulfurovum sp.]
MSKDSIKIRMPALGGQGAVTAAHIAATAADTEGYYAVSNPFFGAEKRMAPSESYTRIGTVPIYDRGEVIYPDIIMVYHPQVITMGKSYTMPFYSGIKENGLVLINSDHELVTDSDRKFLESKNVKVLTRDFTKFAVEIAGTELATNMAMLGALFGALGTIGKSAIEEGIKDRFLKKYVASGGTASLDSVIEKKFKKKLDLIQSNLDTASAAYDLTAAWAKEVGLAPILDPIA